MTSFAHIIPIAKYDKVSYYSVCIDESEKSLFDDFIKYHTKHNKEKLNHILEWLKQIGNKYGAQKHLFRSEAEFADASALPPIGMEREPTYSEYGKIKANNLRLYCLRANQHVVFLFDGDIKTADLAQNCPNVRDYFKKANQLTKAIDNAFRSRDIVWNDDCTEIECDDDFKLQF